MELRVWVDGAQRVVCGVKLTTTCQEIVFALAHATQQAGRFTMIERWRNNERLLSPNEQPLVTLQRWGDHMNEVEFILRKTSTDIPNHNHLKSSPSQQQQQQQQQPMMPILPNHSLRASMSASTLPNLTNNMTASPSNQQSLLMQPLYYNDDQNLNASLTSSASSSSLLRNPINGYSLISETQHQQQQQKLNNQSQTEQAQVSKNYPFDDLYGTINKRRTNGQPPVVPAKPRSMAPILPVAHYNLPQHPQLQPINNAQLNFYHTSKNPHNICANNFRPRHPPGYQDYMEALAGSRNSLLQPMLQNQNYAQQNRHPVSNMYQRSFDSQMFCLQPNGAGLGINPIHPKLHEPAVVINRGSAVNVKLPSSSKNSSIQTQTTNERPENGSSSIGEVDDHPNSVSKMGYDMLKVIEEQKKVLMNQKNELSMLDSNHETKQMSDQDELINRIENEIRQLEELWKENQAQIQKLENQDFEKELQNLKSEQIKLELEISKQKSKLSRCENDIVLCMTKIEQLESEVANQEFDLDDTSASIQIKTVHDPINIIVSY